jgi:DMSO reductase anchor subunit
MPVEKYLANQEEIRPRPPSAWDDTALLLFTLLAQMAVGGLWATAWMFPSFWAFVGSDAILLRLLPCLVIGLCLGLGMLASLAHLGTKSNAWRIFTNLRHSSLSKEVFFTLFFGLGLLTMSLAILQRQDMTLGVAFAAIMGIGLVYNMAQVYRLPAAPGWNTWRTDAGFFVSALLLGISIMTPLLVYASAFTGNQLSPGQPMVIGLSIAALLLTQLALMRKRPGHTPVHEMRMGLILIGTTLAVITSLIASLNVTWAGIIIFVIVMLEELLGRWLFYRSRL